MSLNEVHISSLVVHVLPEHLDEIKQKIEAHEKMRKSMVTVLKARLSSYLKLRTKVSSQTLSMPLIIYRTS